MTAGELQSLLQACAPYRGLLLETAAMSGLRANELRHLTLGNLDRNRNGLQLDAKWTKNRKATFQPLPASLVERLYDFAQSGEPTRLYNKFYKRKDAVLKISKNPLLYVSSHPARELDKDLQAAGIPKYTSEGKLDFHSFRVAYVNFVIEAGVTVKEAQQLARHATPQLTMNVYGRTREEQLSEAIERVAETVLPSEKCATYVQQGENREGTELASPLENRRLRLIVGSGGGGNRKRRQLAFL